MPSWRELRSNRLALPVFALTAGILLLLSSNLQPAAAGDPVAIVENISIGQAPVKLMEYLETGRSINLKSGDRIALGYFRSCIQEKISGGRIIVGENRSIVSGGSVTRLKVECDGGRMRLNPAQAATGAATVFRAGPKGKTRTKARKPQLIVFGTNPVINLAQAGETVTIQRLDELGEPMTVSVKGRFVDLAKRKISLKPGGIYLISAAGRGLTVKIDALAEPGAVPLISRLIRI